MFTFMQEAIADKVKTVRLSKKLKTHPVCLSSDGSITIEMEKASTLCLRMTAIRSRLKRLWR